MENEIKKLKEYLLEQDLEWTGYKEESQKISPTKLEKLNSPKYLPQIDIYILKKRI